MLHSVVNKTANAASEYLIIVQVKPGAEMASAAEARSRRNLSDIT